MKKTTLIIKTQPFKGRRLWDVKPITRVKGDKRRKLKDKARRREHEQEQA